MVREVVHREAAIILDKVANKYGSLRSLLFNNSLKLSTLPSSNMECEEEKEKNKRKQFGTRYLHDESRVFDHNAWDDVPWTEEQEREALEIIADQMKKSASLSVEDDVLCVKNSQVSAWDRFYSTHERKFFMNRNWLLTEFPELHPQSLVQVRSRQSVTHLQKEEMHGQYRVLEVGCGAGNSVYPLLDACQHSSPPIFLYCCDQSSTAVDLVLSNSHYDPSRCCAFVWDICNADSRVPIAAGSLDVVLCVFVLSAIPAEKLPTAIDNLVRLLRPGGIFLLKDYGKYDMTQLRFKPQRLLEEGLYKRGDDTLVHFFDCDQLHGVLTRNGQLQAVSKCAVDRRLIVNRATKQRMYRIWVMGKYRRE